MMKTQSNKLNSRTFRLGGMLAVAIFALCGVQNVWAAVAANTTITNTAQLSFDDGSGPQTVNASVDVTVSLVACTPALDDPTDLSTTYVNAATLVTYTYTVTACGNGPDTYTAATGTGAQTNNANDGTAAETPTNFILGATITIGGSTTTVLSVPSDGATDAEVNGIAVGDDVDIGGEVRTVTAIDDQASGTSTITLGVALSGAPGVGVEIDEVGTFTVDVLAGTRTVAGVDVTVTSLTNVGNSGGTTADVTAVSTFTAGSASLLKFVRNVTNPVVGAGTINLTVNSVASDYYSSGVTGATNDVLEYVLVAANAGTSAVNDSTITDTLPSTAFVVFVPDAYGAGNDVSYTEDGGGETFLTDGGGDDAAELAGTTLTINVGTGAGIALVPASGGSIGVGESVQTAFQVVIQ